jgi:hypothetical protein
MRIVVRIAAWAAFLVAFQLNAGTDPSRASGASRQPRLAKPTPSERSDGGTCQQRLLKKQQIKKAIREQRVIVGMTQKEVRSSWGWPELTHPVQGIDESTDRWTFRRKGQGTVDLYFRNGILVRIDR